MQILLIGGYPSVRWSWGPLGVGTWCTGNAVWWRQNMGHCMYNIHCNNSTRLAPGLIVWPQKQQTDFTHKHLTMNNEQWVYCSMHEWMDVWNVCIQVTLCAGALKLVNWDIIPLFQQFFFCALYNRAFVFILGSESLKDVHGIWGLHSTSVTTYYVSCKYYFILL